MACVLWTLEKAAPQWFAGLVRYFVGLLFSLYAVDYRYSSICFAAQVLGYASKVT